MALRSVVDDDIDGIVVANRVETEEQDIAVAERTTRTTRPDWSSASTWLCNPNSLPSPKL